MLGQRQVDRCVGRYGLLPTAADLVEQGRTRTKELQVLAEHERERVTGLVQRARDPLDAQVDLAAYETVGRRLLFDDGVVVQAGEHSGRARRSGRPHHDQQGEHTEGRHVRWPAQCAHDTRAGGHGTTQPDLWWRRDP